MMTNDQINIGLVGNRDKNIKTLSNLIKEEFRELDLSFEFINSDIGFSTILIESEYDVFFLDADIPDLDLQKIKRMKQNLFPFLILISSSKTKALDAFEINALDFLLKPLQGERIKKCLEILREKMIAFKVIEKINRLDKIELPTHNANGDQYLSRILIREGKKMFFLDVDSIIWVESDGNYNRIHTKDDNYLNRGSLKHFLKKLEPDKFFRIHRSAIVNIEMIKEIQPFFHGDYKVMMKDNTELKISRNYSDFLSEFKCTV